MTIGEAISRTDKLCPNMIPTAEKVKWLDRLDGKIWREVYETHFFRQEPGKRCKRFRGYDDSAPQTTPLLVPYPFDEDIYMHYLKAQIAQANGEAGKYNQEITLYNDAFQQFAADYNRHYQPKPQGRRFLF